MKFKTGDTVFINAGKDKGRKGKVLKTLPRESRVIVEGINMRKKHVRAKRQGEKGQIVNIPAPFHVSNVQIISPGTGKPDRVGYTIENGKKISINRNTIGNLDPGIAQFIEDEVDIRNPLPQKETIQ